MAVNMGGARGVARSAEIGTGLVLGAFLLLVSTWGLFDAQLLYVSRIPYVMARDGWLPESLSHVQSDTAAPRAAIMGFCLVIALLALRVRRPDAERPFRVPGGIWGLLYVCLAPVAVAAMVLSATLRDGGSYGIQLGIVAAVVFAGVALYGFRYKHALALRAAESARGA